MEFNETYLRELTEVVERSKSNSHRLDEVEQDIKNLSESNKALYEMSASIKTLTDGVFSIRTDVKEIKEEQGEMKTEIQTIKTDSIKSKASAFDSVWKFVATAIGTGLVAFILGQVCPTIFGG